MNIFSKIKILILLTTIVIILASITTAISNEFSALLVYISSFCAVVTFIISFLSINKYEKSLQKSNEVLKKVAAGSLYHRVTNIDSSEKFGEISWNINNLLDQVEAFNRDTSASLKSITTCKSVRRMLPSGLHGDFVIVSNEINSALETIAVAQSKDEFIKQMLSTLSEYSSGIYTSKIDLSGMQEDIIQLGQGINTLGTELSKLGQVNLKNGLALQQGAEVLASNVKILSTSANTQATSLEETAAALEQITEGMRQNTENTVQMAQYAKDVTKSANEGEELANKTTTSMDEINEQTASITEAITVIDQIAFQTNILSLNAAVEAATAGEAGKGFAVVAQEVRNLASRSAEAAKQIKDIVEAATSKANEGKLIADSMIEGYNKLNKSISTTIDLIEEVTVSSKEQEEGIIQINESISILDKQTQESASVAHETNVVAQQSYDIAERIVQEADKEFHGKDDIQLRKELTNVNFEGQERRSIEKRIKNNQF
jgi:methyl-accepting chemotaxis protein